LTSVFKTHSAKGQNKKSIFYCAIAIFYYRTYFHESKKSVKKIAYRQKILNDRSKNVDRFIKSVQVGLAGRFPGSLIQVFNKGGF
jgi:hypothetical protein